jgi:hypothetical protein
MELFESIARACEIASVIEDDDLGMSLRDWPSRPAVTSGNTPGCSDHDLRITLYTMG